MAIKTVQAIINGNTYELTYNSSTGNYEATITAPGKTSHNQTGGYYNVQIKATNDAGTVGTADAFTLDGLKLVVKERVAPVITIISPSSGAYVQNSKQPVVFTVIDETDGSGIKLTTLVVKVDGTAQSRSAIATTAVTGGYQVTFTPASALTDGSHTVTIDVSDHDGNTAAQKITTFTVDTIPPTLNITAPTEGLITATDAPGRTPTEGLITATDAPGRTTTVPKITAVSVAPGRTTTEGLITATLDTSVPKITAASVAPNPVDVSRSVVVSVTIA